MEALPDRFEVVIEGKPQGPFTLDDLRGMQLGPTDFVKPAGFSEFKELREIASLSALLNIRHEASLPQYFATLDTRLLALAIDYFIAFCEYAIIAAIFLAGTADAKTATPSLLAGLVLVPLLKFITAVVMEGSKRQATVGKLLVGIKVTDEKGLPLSFGSALWRNAAKLTGVLSLGIGFLMGFFDRRQRCLHDKLAGTLVIKDRLI